MYRQVAHDIAYITCTDRHRQLTGRRYSLHTKQVVVLSLEV